MPQTDIPLSLLTFNLGVEAGHGRFEVIDVIEDLPGIYQFQIVQQTADALVVRIVRDAGAQADGRVDLMMGRGNTGPVYPWFGKDITKGIELAVEN